jgi:hypothetical protein
MGRIKLVLRVRLRQDARVVYRLFFSLLMVESL